MAEPLKNLEPASSQPSAPPTCANCGVELKGPYCHACGQPTRHVLKHLPALAEDVLDLAFNLDGRIMHTLPALYLRPGLLACEYFAGRRARYIPPFRLMFLLSVLAFLLIQLKLNLDRNMVNIRLGDAGTQTAAQVQADLDRAQQRIAQERKQPGNTPMARKALEATDRVIQEQAVQARSATAAEPAGTGTASLDAALRPGGAAAVTGAAAGTHASVSEKKSGILTFTPVSWLPGFINERIETGFQRARANFRTMRLGQVQARNAALRRFLAETLSVLPQALFVLLPVFAILLKVVYLFQRRLYIEHLMVALYSHAFIFMTLMLSALVGLGRLALPAWAGPATGWLQLAIWAWLPLYLLLMQKRVYAQGWFTTLLKYAFVGLCYSILMSFAVASAALIGLAA
jgi:hypothetical protein